MKRYFEVGLENDGIYSVNVIYSDAENAENAVRKTAEKRAVRYGYRIAYVNEIATIDAEYKREKGMPVYAADPIEPEPDKKPVQIEKKPSEKMTKKEIYASYGIEYDGNNHILYNGRWIRELLKEGNSKTGKRVYTWSMLPGTNGTCVCDCPGCYAKTGFYNAHSVIESLKLNTSIVNDNIDFFERAVNAQLETLKSGQIRIHAAGDFNTKDPDAYAATWHRIAEKNQSFVFWTYTKIKRFETLFNDLDNANIVKSVIDGVGYNFGHCDYILKVYHMLKKAGANVYICRCGIDKNQHCQDCTHCATCDFVLFIEHSTDYVAEKDPAFETLKNVIDNQ